MGHQVGRMLVVVGFPLLWAVPLGGALTMAIGALCCAISTELALDEPKRGAALAVVPTAPDTPG